MRYFFANSLDEVDPGYDFLTDTSSPNRCRQTDDVYPHQLLKKPPYDGILISRSSVGCLGGKVRLSQGQRFRIMREGIREFLKFPHRGYRGNPDDYPIMGDCGAFSYSHLKTPPFGVREIADFYESFGFTHGISPDHIIFQKNEKWDLPKRVPSEIVERAEFTMKSAIEFFKITKKRGFPFVPVGAIQGWSPASFAMYAEVLCRCGYSYLALGGLAARPTQEIYNIVSEVRTKVPTATKLHLLGFTRFKDIERFNGLGVNSFDSSSPMLRAFKDDTDNYYSPDGRHYAAFKIPSLSEAKLKNQILRGQINPDVAAELEANCLAKVRACARREVKPEEALNALLEYERLWTDRGTMVDQYIRTLEEMPWENCACEICKKNGVEILIYRGRNRNKRRGGHNLYVFYNKLQGVNKMNVLEVPCIRAQQGKSRFIYSFVVDGKDISKFASTSRISRDEGGAVIGYQRQEIYDHVSDIRNYLEDMDSMLPNSLVIAFNRPLKFRQEKEYSRRTYVGTLEIPIGSDERTGWIVDGQQRAAALRAMKKESLPISIIGFESRGIDDEREQFVLTNSTRPLPKSLVYELLPSLGQSVPPKLKKRQRAYGLLERLNYNPQSPFYRRVKTATSLHPESANIKDLSVLKMIENSIDNGILSKYPLGEEKPLRILLNFWSAVKSFYRTAWELPPQKSRLTHGAGIISMGYIMDAMCFRLSGKWEIPPEKSFLKELGLIGQEPAWTEGTWHFSDVIMMPWSEVQNTSKHIELVANYLIRKYNTALRQESCKQFEKVSAGVRQGKLSTED